MKNEMAVLIASTQWVAAGISAAFLPIQPAFLWLALLCLVDYVTGWAVAAFIERNLSSYVGYRGLVRKALMLLLVVLLQAGTKVMQLPVDVASGAAALFMLNEFVSIVENCARAGVPIPDPLVMALKAARKMTGRGKSAQEVMRELDGE